jgi:tripartite ATP-independent transporter DctP family solute receptor
MCRTTIARTWAATLLVGVLTALFFGPAAAQKTYNFRVGFQTGNPDTPVYATAVKLKESVEQRTNGRIKLTLFPGGQLGNQIALVSGVRTGAIDIGIMVAWSVATVEPSALLPDLPFLFDDLDSVRKILDGPGGNKILSYLEPKGIKGLSWSELGLRGIIGNKPIRTPADMKGLKIRVVPNALYIAAWKAAGANPVPLPFGEIYLALQQGVIDAVDTNYEAFYGAKHYEVSDYLALTDHMYTAAIIGMNLRKFEGLPADLQKALLQAAEDAKIESWTKAQAIEERAKQVIGDNVIEVTRPDRAKFQAAMQSVYKEYEAAVGKDLLELAGVSQ